MVGDNEGLVGDNEDMDVMLKEPEGVPTHQEGSDTTITALTDC